MTMPDWLHRLTHRSKDADDAYWEGFNLGLHKGYEAGYQTGTDRGMSLKQDQILSLLQGWATSEDAFDKLEQAIRGTHPL